MDPAPPLAGLRVLVTRPHGPSDGLTERLAARGARVTSLPLIELRQVPLPSDGPLQHLAGFDWIVFSSANAVTFFMEGLAAAGVRTPEPVHVAAVGPATAEALTDRGMRVDLVPDTYRAEELVAALAPRLRPGARILVPRAREGREALLSGLAALEAQVVPLVLYETRTREEARDELARVLEQESPAVIVAASGSAVSALFELGTGTAWRLLPLACIGPVTANRAAELGHANILIAPEASVDGLVALLVDRFGPPEKGGATPGSARDFGLT